VLNGSADPSIDGVASGFWMAAGSKLSTVRRTAVL
jgi:hypothetical protein